MHKPNALQRLAQELKTFDWHYDPDNQSGKSARQEEKIKRLIKQCKELEVRELWETAAPTAKFPTPFGLKHLKQDKPSKRKRLLKGELPVHPTQTYKRRKELGLPDTTGEVSRWTIECGLLRMAAKHNCSVHEVAADPKKLKEAGLKDAVISKDVIDATERDRKNYAAAMLNVHSSGACRMMAEAVMRNELLLSDVEQRYGEQFVRRIRSEIGRVKDEKACEQYNAAPATNTNGKPPKAGSIVNSKPSTSARASVLGYTVSGLAQWMAKQGYDFANIRRAFNELGALEAKDSTIKTAITDVKNPKYARPATVDEASAKKIKELLGTKAAAKPAEAPAKQPKHKAPNKPIKATEPKVKAGAKAPSKTASAGPKQAPSKAPSKATKGKPVTKGKPAKQPKGKNKRS